MICTRRCNTCKTTFFPGFGKTPSKHIQQQAHQRLISEEAELEDTSEDEIEQLPEPKPPSETDSPIEEDSEYTAFPIPDLAGEPGGFVYSYYAMEDPERSNPERCGLRILRVTDTLWIDSLFVENYICLPVCFPLRLQ